jgi:3-hydroxybutyryl-CoA dehydratase
VTATVPSVDQESQIYADDLVVGQTFSGPPHLVGDKEFTGFAALTGDDHPIHYDDAFAARTRFGKRLAHGLLLMSMTALGATPKSHRIRDAMVAFAEQGCRFLAPVFVGDQVATHFTVSSIERKPGKNTALVRFDIRLVNQAGTVVLQGYHAYFLRLRPADVPLGNNAG